MKEPRTLAESQRRARAAGYVLVHGPRGWHLFRLAGAGGDHFRQNYGEVMRLIDELTALASKASALRQRILRG